MVIQHNMASFFTQRQLGFTTTSKAKSSEKLSSGYRINRAADDAAGLAISEKMRRQIRGMQKNLENIQEGISFCQVADGYLNEVHDMIQRVNELAVHSANGTLTDEDREYLNDEVKQIKSEIENIFDGAKYNEMLIFRVPYHPSVVPETEPYDMQIFYSNSGQLGGLEFNNVRYNISELNAKGMSLDSNGVATRNQDVEFNLWDGEYVRLILKAGQSLDDVKRRYKWTADNTGISINNVQAVTWAQLGVVGDGTDGGHYSFNFRGMDISFYIEENDSMQRIQAGINGGSITQPAYWELGVSSTTPRSIVTYNSGSTVTASEANKNYFDHKYGLSADANGVRVVDRADGTGTPALTQWSEFRNVGPSIDIDTINSGFPIVDWGIDNDDNGQSQITFDTLALYQYTSKNSAMPISFTYNLADVASQNQVVGTMNETEFMGSIYSPATLVDGATNSTISGSDGSSVSIYNKRIADSGDTGFGLQRSYGRNFDTDSTLTGQITWTIQDVPAEATAQNHTYSHTSFVGYDTPPSVTDQRAFYYYDANSNSYYKLDMTEITSVSNMKTDDTYEWTETYDITYDGTLGTANMKDATQRVTIGLKQDGETTFKRTNVSYSYENETLLTDEEVVNLLSAGVTFETQFMQNTSTESDRTAGNSTITVQPGLFAHRQNFVDESEGNDNNYAFTIYHELTYDQIYGSASGSANLDLSFDGKAIRTFTPKTKNYIISEHDFMDVQVYTPKKNMYIQSSSDSPINEQIALSWDCLTLNSVYLAGTDISTESKARAAIDQAKKGIRVISEERGIFGANQNRMEHAYKGGGNSLENTQDSESLIRDTDMGKEYSRYSAHSILEQAGQSMLAQANQTNQGVLKLLQ